MSTRSRREKVIETRGVRLLESIGMLTRKDGKLGWPDRLVLVAPGVHFWWEVKTPEGSLTRHQKIVFETLREHGDNIVVGGDSTVFAFACDLRACLAVKT
jgi:hypothetical protein